MATQKFDHYRRRVVDTELDDMLSGLPAISLEGPKGVGKTATALQRARTVHRLDDPATLEVVRAGHSRILGGDEPILVDEWQRYEPSWDAIRRSIDDDRRPGRFLLTGSATPSQRSTHSGAGRIVSLRMRPLTLGERGTESPTVSLEQLLNGGRNELEGSTSIGLEDYVTEIVMGGFPGMRVDAPGLQRRFLDGYISRIVDADLPEIGVEVRHPSTLRRWLSAYAAATGTTTSYERIRDAATAGIDNKPARTTTIPYREALERLWILEPLPAWLPSRNHLSRMVQSPKHHLADPALAARLLGVNTTTLLDGKGPTAIARDGTFLGALFESLATLSLRVFAQPASAQVSHFRTRAGEREVDLIVEDDGGRILAIEVKLSETVEDSDVEHLHWLSKKIGDDLIDAIVLTTGRFAYRRPDGIGVVPLALLGP
jgi:uncharacterized protein